MHGSVTGCDGTSFPRTRHGNEATGAMRSERTSTSTRYRLELVEKVVDVLTAFTPTIVA